MTPSDTKEGCGYEKRAPESLDGVAVTGALSCPINRVLMVYGVGMWIKLLKNIYVRIVFVALAVFIVVWIVIDLSAGVFWGVLTGAALFFLTFNPRIKRHW